MYSSEDKLIILINNIDFLTYKKKAFLVSQFKDFNDLKNNYNLKKALLLQEISLDNYNKLALQIDDQFINSFINNLEKSNISAITFKNPNYSKYLLEIPSPPLVLYCIGNIKLLNTPSLAIVGTRRCTKYGKEITEKFSREIAQNGITIVSGLADGVDSIAHRGAIDVKGNTIAVIGSGFYHIYPATNIPLYEKIIENNGLVVTEYKPSEKPQTFHFPARNRIIAGLCKGTLVTEAPVKSGSMITKDYALEFNRDIYAICGRLTDIYSTGCNELIKEYRNAMVTSPSDIIEDYGLIYNEINKPKETIQLDFDEEVVLNTIGADTIHFDELLSKTKIEIYRLTYILMKLELKDLIKKYPGNYYSK